MIHVHKKKGRRIQPNHYSKHTAQKATGEPARRVPLMHDSSTAVKNAAKKAAKKVTQNRKKTKAAVNIPNKDVEVIENQATASLLTFLNLNSS